VSGISGPYNVLEEMVRRVYDQAIQEFPGVCSCEQCKTDTLSLALNELDSKYVGSSSGETRVRVELEGTQSQIDIWLALRKAIKQVNRTPHHHRL